MTNVTRITPKAMPKPPKAPAAPRTAPVVGDRLWTIQETSEYLGVPVNTLYQWRAMSEGPKAYKLGKHLRYDPADIRAWLETRVA